MANMWLLIGIIAGIVIIAVAAVVLTSKGSGGNELQPIRGSAGTLSYETISASGTNTQSLTTPIGNGYYFCLEATWNATSQASSVAGPQSLTYAIQPLCPWVSSMHGTQESAVGVMTIYNASKYTYVWGSFTSPSTNYSVNNSASELTVIPFACEAQGCGALTLPSGCSTITQSSDSNASVEIAVCADQSPGRYTISGPSGSSHGPNVYMFYS